MNHGKYFFSQLFEFQPQRVFDRFVVKYVGNKQVRHFTCWNQLLCLFFGQFTSRDSLRDLIIVIEAHQSKSYHLGFLNKCNTKQFIQGKLESQLKIFEDFANHLILIAQEKKQ